jgi:hypothetical protein
MDREMILEHLAQARQHVALGAMHIARQIEIIDELKSRGHDATEAQLLLKQFKELQVEHTKHRDRLEKLIAEKD